MEKFQISRVRQPEEAPRGLRRAFPGLFIKERGREAQELRCTPSISHACTMLSVLQFYRHLEWDGDFVAVSSVIRR